MSKSRFSEICKGHILWKRVGTRDHIIDAITVRSAPGAIAFDDRSFALACLKVVMAGLVPAIHAVRHAGNDVDARDQPGHDGVTNWRTCSSRRISICSRTLVSLGKRSISRPGHDHSRGGRSSISCSPCRIAVGRSCATRSEIHWTSAGRASSFARRRSPGKSRSCAVPTLMLRRS